MFEMLTGRRPFEGATSMEVMHAVLHNPTPALRTSRSDVPEELAAIVDRALQKNPAQRIGSAAEMAAAINALHAQPTVTIAVRDDTSALLRAIRRPAVVIPALLIIGVLGYAAASTLTELSRARWAREEAVPEITRLLQVDDYAKAYDLAREADRYIPNDPVLAGLMPQITAGPMFVIAAPSAARVYAKPYASPGSQWQLLDGPLEKVRLPRGTYRWRVEAAGFTTLEFARNVGNAIAAGAPSSPFEKIDLKPEGTVAAGMVPIGPSRAPVDITGFATEDDVALDRFEIDRHEVTNRQFKEFVVAGGYSNRDYWKHDVVREGRRLAFDEAMALFHDTTGKPGPATWELGDFPPGHADLPVSGVSWYEAAAYAEFRGASLPTIYHWARAALAYTRGAPIRGLIVNASNFGGKAPADVESSGALGPFGNYDMAGNVREWCVNNAGDNRWILGGSWSDHAYMYVVPYSLPPLDRSTVNGFRLVRYSEKERVAELSEPIEVFRRDFRTAKPVSDEVFDVFKRQFTYTAAAVAAKLETKDTSALDYVRERVSIDTGYGDRMAVDLFIPKTGASTYQVVRLLPGADRIHHARAESEPSTASGDGSVRLRDQERPHVGRAGAQRIVRTLRRLPGPDRRPLSADIPSAHARVAPGYGAVARLPRDANRRAGRSHRVGRRQLWIVDDVAGAGDGTAFSHGRAATGGPSLSRHASRGRQRQLRAANHIAGVDARRALRSFVSSRALAAAAVRAVWLAGRSKADGALRRRAWPPAARTGDPRNTRVAGQISRAHGAIKLNEGTTHEAFRRVRMDIRRSVAQRAGAGR
jgi:formylglycine-generating enzyme required for sulfatase activity